MENVKLNLAHDLLLKRTKLSSTFMSAKKKNDDSGYHTYFVICNSCYWCASYFNIDDLESQVIACHTCNSHNTEIIPIGTGESFRIESNHMGEWKLNSSRIIIRTN